MIMELTVPPQTIPPPLVPPRTAPEETFSATSLSAGRPNFNVTDARLDLMQADQSFRRQFSLEVKAAVDEGFRSFDLGDMRGAEAGFKRLAEILPSSMSYTLWAFTYFNREDYLRAANLLEKAIRYDPMDAHAQSTLGLTYRRLGKLPKAIKAFRQSLRANPDDAGIRFYLGHLYSTLGQWQEAIAEYREAIRLKKDFLEAYQYLADVYLDRGRTRTNERDERFQQAIDVYRELIDNTADQELFDHNRNIAAAYNNIGVIYSELGNYEETKKAYEKALIYDPDDVIGLTNVGFAYTEAKRFEDARPIWKRLAEILEKDEQPNTVLLSQAYYNLGAATINVSSAQFMETGIEDPKLVEEAQKAFERSIIFDPQFAYSYVGLGITHTRQGRPEEARETFFKALEIDPFNVSARDNLRVMPLDKIYTVVQEGVEAAKRGMQVDADELAGKVAEIYRIALKEQETGESIGIFTPDEMVGALSPIVKQMDNDLRFRFAAKLFEKDLLSSGKAARLAGMDRVTFLLDLHKVGVAAIDLDEEQLESQARYVNSR